MSQENVETVLRGYAAFSRGDLTTVLEQFDPEVVSYTAAPLDPAEYRGHEGFLEWCENWLSAFDEFAMEVERHVDAGEAVVLQVRQNATGQTSGVPVERTFWFVHTFSGGRIARIGIHATEEQALEAAGLSEYAMSQENVELVRRIFDAFSRGDFEGGIKLADTPPEFEFVPSGALIPDLAAVQRGPDAFRRVVETFTAEFDDARVELRELIDAGDQVFTSFTLHGRGKHSGVETTWEPLSVWTVRDGRLVRWLGFTDRAKALEAAGLSE